jgi:signal transduction histidine kinase
LQLQVQSISRGLRRRVVHDEAGERSATKVRIAERQLERLGRLVEELLDVSRITAGHLRLEPEILSLGNLAAEVVARMGEEIRTAGCTTTFRPDPRAIGNWDRLRIEQVATNLISNAIKYGAGKLIEISVSVEGGDAVLAVRDHGIGIAPALQERIFERFGRAVPARDYPGLGLGLFIARQIVDAHGGTIRVVSAPGQGATFRVELPMDIPESVPVYEAGQEGMA